jgi:hypothetical protein
MRFWPFNRKKRTFEECKFKRSDKIEQIADALTYACHVKGYAVPDDTANLPIARSTRYYLINKLVEQGRFEKRGLDYFLAPPPIEEEPAALEASKALSPETSKVLGGKAVVHMTTLEMLQKIGEPPVGNRTEPVTTAEPDNYSWDTLAKQVPPELAPAVKQEYDASLSAGNPLSNVFNHCLRVFVPKLYKQRMHQQIREYATRYTMTEFEEDLARGLTAEFILEEVKRLTAIKPQPSVSPPPQPPIHKGKVRETADNDAFLRGEMRDLQSLYAGKDRVRTFISMDQENAPSYEKTISDINRADGGANLGHYAR